MFCIIVGIGCSPHGRTWRRMHHRQWSTVDVCIPMFVHRWEEVFYIQSRTCYKLGIYRHRHLHLWYFTYKHFLHNCNTNTYIQSDGRRRNQAGRQANKPGSLKLEVGLNSSKIKRFFPLELASNVMLTVLSVIISFIQARVISIDEISERAELCVIAWSIEGNNGEPIFFSVCNCPVLYALV